MQIKAIGRNHLSIQNGHCQKLDKHYLMEVWRKGNIPPLMLAICVDKRHYEGLCEAY